MSHIPDLAPWSTPNEHTGTLRAVGWLMRGQPYTRGEVSEDFFRALIELLVEPWQPAATAGRHACSLCRFVGGPGQIHYRGTTITLGVSNVFVPGEEVVYVAPSLVAHYVDAHEYQPPIDFVSAVLECPPMRSFKYLQALKSLGGAALMKARKEG